MCLTALRVQIALQNQIEALQQQQQAPAQQQQQLGPARRVRVALRAAQAGSSSGEWEVEVC